jgi:hypothetical protein
VGEHLGAQVVDEPFTDAGGEPSRHHTQGRAEERGQCHQPGQHEHQGGVLLEDPVVDDALDQQRGDDDETGVDDGERQERGDQPAVRAREGEHPADRAPVELALRDAAVGAHVAPRLAHPRHA